MLIIVFQSLTSLIICAILSKNNIYVIVGIDLGTINSAVACKKMLSSRAKANISIVSQGKALKVEIMR